MFTDETPLRVTWRGTVAEFQSRRMLKGVVHHYSKSVDLAAFGVSRGGLLEEAVNSLSPPVDFTEANQLSSMLEALKTSESSKRLLSTPLKDLTKEDLVALFQAMESAIADSTRVAKENKNAVSAFWRRPFTRPALVLGDGTITSSAGFRSTFPSHMSAEGKLRAGQKKAAKLYSDAVSKAIDLEEPELSWKKSIGEAISSLEKACWNVIDDFLNVRRLHIEMRESGTSSVAVGSERTGEGILLRTLIRIENDKLYRASNWVDGVLPCWEAITGCPYHYTKSLRADPEKLFQTKKLRWQEYFFASYYLPRLVVQAAQILILCRTGWNVSTVAGLEKDQVHVAETYCDLFSTKTKSDDAFHVRLYISKEPRLVEVMKLLLANDEAVSRDWKRCDNTIWISWTSSGMPFATDMHDRSLDVIAANYGCRRISKKAIRDYKHVHSWLEHKDIFRSREELNHGGIDTALAYLNLHVFSVLNEANMAKFMRRLAKTIVWIGRDGISENERTQLLDGYDGQNLLFPLPVSNSASTSQTAACDRWIADSGTGLIQIGYREIEHLKWQIRYYTKYALDLSRDNPHQFQTIHLPRMLFAAALSRVVAESQYERLLNE